jgi:hypothetical protein
MLDWFDYNLMKANPDKFQALAIGKKSFDHKIVFELKGNRIECENDVKLLGVTIDYDYKQSVGLVLVFFPFLKYFFHYKNAR